MHGQVCEGVQVSLFSSKLRMKRQIISSCLQDQFTEIYSKIYYLSTTSPAANRPAAINSTPAAPVEDVAERESLKIIFSSLAKCGNYFFIIRFFSGLFFLSASLLPLCVFFSFF